MADVGNVEFPNMNEQDAALNVLGSDLLATMELVYGEALDPTLASLLQSENNETIQNNTEDANVSPNKLEEANTKSSTVNEDLRNLAFDSVPQKEPKNIELNAPSTMLNSESTNRAKNVVEPSVGSTSTNLADENSRSQSPKAAEPISSKRNARKASQREDRLAAEKPSKKAKSLADLTPEQLDTLMELAQMPEYPIGDIEYPKSTTEAKNSALESFPGPVLAEEKMTIVDQQNSETFGKMSEVADNASLPTIDISPVPYFGSEDYRVAYSDRQITFEPVDNHAISKETGAQVVEKKADVPRRGRTAFLTKREGDDYICLTCQTANRTPWRFRHAQQIAAHVRLHQFHPRYLGDVLEDGEKDKTNVTQASAQPTILTTDQRPPSPTPVTAPVEAVRPFNVETCTEAEFFEDVARLEAIHKPVNEGKSNVIIEETPVNEGKLNVNEGKSNVNEGKSNVIVEETPVNEGKLNVNEGKSNVIVEETPVTAVVNFKRAKLRSKQNKTERTIMLLDDEKKFVNPDGKIREREKSSKSNRNNNGKFLVNPDGAIHEKEKGSKNMNSRKNDEDINGHEVSMGTVSNETLSSRKNPNLPNPTIVKAMKETLKALKKTQRQWAYETDMPEVELSKYLNDYYSPRAWTSFEETLKTWLKKNAPASIAKKYKSVFLSKERFSSFPNQRSVTHDINISTKGGIDDQRAQKMMANGVMVTSSMGNNHVVDTSSSSMEPELLDKNADLGTSGKSKELEYGEVLVLDLLKELHKVKASASLSTEDRLNVTENARNVKNYMHGTMTTRPTSSE